MSILGYYTPAELASMLSTREGMAESTIRRNAARGDYLNAFKQGETWFIPLSDIDKWGRGYDKEFAPPRKLSPAYPDDPSDIVIAQNSDDRFGIYLADRWYGAGQALEMLAYLREHEAWLREKAIENDKNSQRKDS